MADVAHNAISGAAVHNGSCVVKKTRLGDTQAITDRAVTYPSVTDIETKYSGRWDNPRYYEGDTAN